MIQSFSREKVMTELTCPKLKGARAATRVVAQYGSSRADEGEATFVDDRESRPHEHESDLLSLLCSAWMSPWLPHCLKRPA
jgi:hypothetical protein